MKRIFFLVLPFFVLALANCGYDLSTSQMASAVQTLTATVLPPTATVTPDPDESAIVILLNHGLDQTTDPLSQTIDARYQVVDASFPIGLNQLATTFRIDARCECLGTACCTPERTFVVVMNAMKPVADKVARQVPASVVNVQVVCLDQSTQIGMMIVSWRDMVDYFSGTINGFQLGARTFKLVGP